MFFPVDVLELISVWTPCVGIGDAERIIPTEPKTHQRVNLAFLCGVQKMLSHESATKYFK